MPSSVAVFPGRWLADPDHAGIVVDFDGTIAPIVPSPPDARPLPEAVAVLAAIAARRIVVAVVSGRPAAFLVEHVPAPSVQKWGSYGLERVTDVSVEVSPEAAAWRPVVSAAAAAARSRLPADVRVEDKGVALTLHYRGATDAADAAVAFARAKATETGLVVHEARMSIELRPPIGVDKGWVVRRLVEAHGLTAVMAVGDDVGDIAAFRALDDVAVALRVAVRSDEAPAELLASADLTVDGPRGVVDLLRRLASAPR